MKILFHLSQENLDIAIYEVISLLDIKKYTLNNHFLSATVSQNKVNYIKRLAYTHAAYQILFSATKNTLYERTKKFQWQNYYQQHFAVRCHGFSDEHELAGFIYDQLKKPKVNLQHPKTSFDFFKIDAKNCIYVAAKKIWTNNKEFLQRKAHFKPVLYPASLHPKLARAALNMVIRKGIVLDPFCGTGGILVEAVFLGFKAIGTDISQTMLDAAKKNADYYGLSKIKQIKLVKADAAKVTMKADVIVTDLPYGKNTGKIENINKLYLAFLKNAEHITNKAVIMFPDFVDYKKIIKRTNWKMIKEFKYYLHKSLSKKIIILHVV